MARWGTALTAVMGLMGLMGLLASPWPAAAQTPSYHVTELPLVLDGKAALATAINNVGQVVGETPEGWTSKSYIGWLWNPSTAQTVALTPVSGYPRSKAYDINDTGQVVGMSYVHRSAYRATLWQAAAPNKPLDFNAVAVKGAALPDWVLTEATAVSNAASDGGYYVAGYGDYTEPITKVVTINLPLVWKMKDGKIVSGAKLERPVLPVLEDSKYFMLSDLNNKEQVSAHYFSNKEGKYVSGIWSAVDGSLIQQLPNVGSVTHALNDAGSVIGDGEAARPSRVYFFAAPYAQTETYYDKQHLGIGEYQTTPSGLNNQNRVVGQYAYNQDGYYWKACLWQPLANGTFQFYNLNDYKSTGAAGIHLSETAGINDSGSIIGRHYTRSVPRAFVLTPLTPLTPQP
jgi:probable HAF family extracellular repeat protein